MVGFKNRYFVMEVFLDPNKGFSLDDPIIITDNNLTEAIRDSIRVNFGDCGLASPLDSFKCEIVTLLFHITLSVVSITVVCLYGT